MTNHSFDCFLSYCGQEGLGKSHDFLIGDLSSFGHRTDTLSYSEVDRFLSGFRPDAILLGDIFWTTGQNICQWGNKHNCRTFFLQHGQWIYTVNKKRPHHIPDYTLFLGEDVKNECSKWPYSDKSELVTVGCPRFDKITKTEGSGFYCAPHILNETYVSSPTNHHKKGVRSANLLRSVAVKLQEDLKVHPHYREGSIKELKKILKGATFLDSKLDSIPLVMDSRAVITHRNSTTVLDAIAAYKPIHLLNCRELSSCYPKGYFSPFAKEYDTIDQLVEGLDEPVNEIKDYEAKSKNYIYLGNASERIADLIFGTKK